MSPSIHAFSIPPSHLQSITLRSYLSQKTAGIPDKEDVSTQPQTAPINGARACNVCLGATFLDVEEQRTHFRSDWHRYNVKVRLRGGNPISEVDFAKLVDSTSLFSVFGTALPSTAHSQALKTLYLAPLPTQTMRAQISLMPLATLFRGSKFPHVPLLHLIRVQLSLNLL
jgi:hypothetical protein